jgi:hypothetical protein
MSSPENERHRLDDLLRKPYQSPESLLPDELSYVVTAFLPTKHSTLRSKAYLVLSAFCQGVRGSSSGGQEATQALSGKFKPLVVSHLSETVEGDYLAGLSFLTALFQVDGESAANIFQQDGFVDYIMDSFDIFPNSTLMPLQIAHLLGQASGHKTCRPVIASHFVAWLHSKLRQTKDNSLRAASAIALIKISRGTAADNADVSGSNVNAVEANEEELATLMKGIVIGDNNQSSLIDAIEGLAYLSVDPNIKEALTSDVMFLSKLFALVPRRKINSLRGEADSGLLFGVVAVIANLCAYSPRLTSEEAQIAKLRRMAQADKRPGKLSSDSDTNPLDDDQHVEERGRKLVASGVLGVLTALVSATESRGVRLNVGNALLSLVENKENRGKVLQSGGAKALTLIIQQSMSAISSKTGVPRPVLDVGDLRSIQALAKLAITSSPVQVFGPNEGAVFDAIRPLSLMLLHPSSSSLQQFEAIMALTNLAVQGPESASRIAKVDGLLDKVELLILEDHTLLRRAATELICNLIVGSEEVFERYGGAEVSSGAKAKLQVLLAMSDVDDVATRLAASGALASLTSAPSACSALFDLHLERHRVLIVLTQLIDPSVLTTESEGDMATNPGLIHRGVVCVRNFLLSIQDPEARSDISMEAEKVGLVRALVNIVKGGAASAVVLKPTAEILQYLKESDGK